MAISSSSLGWMISQKIGKADEKTLAAHKAANPAFGIEQVHFFPLGGIKTNATWVTENGGAFKDTLVNGHVHDRDRTNYIASHIAAVGAALGRGVPMAGYMVWSLLDNFEWASGYAKRFGIVHVDYATQKRTLKDSARWYRRFLKHRCMARKARAAAAAPVAAVAAGP